MTKPISKKPHAHRSTPSAGLGTLKIPGSEICVEIARSLGKFQMDVLSGRLDGRPDRVMEAFRQLNDLNSEAHDTFLELDREMSHLQARWDKLWKLKKSTSTKL